MRHWKRIQKIEKAYGRTVLAFGPFELEKRVVLLVGKNGSGKTTLLKCLAGLLKTDRGFLDYPMTYIGDSDALPLNLTGRAFIDAMLRMVGPDHSTRLERLVEHFDLKPFLDRPIKDYSDGMRKRTLLVGGLLRREGTVLLDEPMRALDGHYQKRLFEWIAQSTMPFMIATHTPSRFSALRPGLVEL
ncbi:MAG: ATP-binding cassette domain-containing protein [Bacillota bacterium]